METARYHLITRLSLTSSPEDVYAALSEVSTWATWWRWCKSITVVATGDDEGIGGRYLTRVRSPMGYGFRYEVEVVDVTRPRSMSVSSSGDLEGKGLFLLDAEGAGGTGLDFTWLVRTPKWWMNLLAPVARPAFVWNHDKMMTDFGRGLASTTQGQLLKAENAVVDPHTEGFFELPTSQG